MKSTKKTQKSNKHSKKPQAQAPVVSKSGETPEEYIVRRVKEEEANGKGLRINARLKNHFAYTFGNGISGAATVKRLVDERVVTVSPEIEPQSGKSFPTIRMWVSPEDAILRDMRSNEGKTLRVDEAYADKFETEHGVSVFETLGVLNRMRIGDKRRPVIDLSSEEECTIVTPWRPKTFDFEGQKGKVISLSRRGHEGRIVAAEVTFDRKTLHLECHKGKWTDALGNVYQGLP